MIAVSEIQSEAPAVFQTPLQEQVYTTLAELGIPFQRVDTDEVITMEDCARINEKLDMKMVKTLFLCDRKQTQFILFITCGDKPFRAKDFSAALGVARLSFAPPERMAQMLGTKIGAATIYSALLATAKEVQIVIDRAVADEPWYGCSDGTTTGYMKVETARILKVMDRVRQNARKLTLALVLLLLAGLSLGAILRLSGPTTSWSLRYNKGVAGAAAAAARNAAIQNPEHGLWPTFWKEEMLALESELVQMSAQGIIYSGDGGLVWPAYFEAGGWPGATDDAGCVVSAALAWRLWGSYDVVGKNLMIGKKTILCAG